MSLKDKRVLVIGGGSGHGAVVAWRRGNVRSGYRQSL
jgi:NAD(P)-dependent dehydrogenase (short-subunit alcohol dehydrogenase family)